MNLLKKQKTENSFYSSADYLKFTGNIYYHDTIAKTDRVIKPLLDAINSGRDQLNNKIVVGLDCEWKAIPRPSKVCLIQLCFDSNECHLFHLSAMNYTIPPSLLSLISHQNCIKVGLNIEADIWKLQRDYCLGLDDVLIGDTKSVVDLSDLANKLLGKSCKWSLSRLTEYVLNKVICKDLQLSDWSKYPLSAEQQRYAAIDVFASYELYFEIKTKGMPFAFDLLL